MEAKINSENEVPILKTSNKVGNIVLNPVLGNLISKAIFADLKSLGLQVPMLIAQL